MSMQSYEKAVHMMTRYPEKMNFVGPRPEWLVEAAEAALRLKFPPTYRRYLLEYGAGSFGGEEVYGVVDENFQQHSHNVVQNTLEQRTKKWIPENYIMIYNTGYGEILCLNLGVQKDGEAPVVAFWPGFPMEAQAKEVVAKDFGELLLQLVQQELTPSEEEAKQ